MEIIEINEREKWNDIVSSFQNTDIYFLNEYADSLQSPEKKGVLLYFEKEHSRLCYPMFIEDIASYSPFHGLIPKGVFYDMETPYGYGGPLFDGTQENLFFFRRELQDWCEKNNIVSQFIRFSPFLYNAVQTGPFFDETRYLHHTIIMDTLNEETIVKNMDSANRNKVRKAKRNNVEIVVEEHLEGIEEFKTVYTQTMDFHNAEDLYYFSDSYYEKLQNDFAGHILLLRAVYQEQTVSAALFFYNEKRMHYHLSGTLREYRNLASGNLLLYRAACWAAEHGIKELHLGGGLEENDSLFLFKKQFNKNGYCDFWIGKTIFLPEVYEKLLNDRKMIDETFDKDNGRMIQYRA